LEQLLQIFGEGLLALPRDKLLEIGLGLLEKFFSTICGLR
jgi:hypothetical protein